MTIRLAMLRFLSLLTASVFLLTSLALPAAQTGMIGTHDYAASEELDQQRAEVIAMLQQEEVRAQLERWGVDPEMAEQRAQSLTADELAELSDRMEQMPAGAGVGSVVGAVVLIFLVLLITDILGFTNVFPFTKAQQ
ncbi:MAG: PA2779 family protein [Ectothiorhodospiraceae bacterium]|nr:PA2779 family protein [Ectothiorhodospiraceae bacterium]MCH8505181.1 PA2779 family protein [Ectothiorhodospiraceae bacterium]